eukprot:2667816-Heterocapsa_arctica.AAC.1
MFNDDRVRLFQKAINKDSSDTLRVFYGRDPRNSMLPLMTVTRDYLNNGFCIISTASYKPRHMLHTCDEDYEALDPNYEEIDNHFPGIRQRVETYDPWNSNNEEEELLMPYLFHLHTHQNEIGFRILNPKEIMIDVDAANFTPKVYQNKPHVPYRENNDKVVW